MNKEQTNLDRLEEVNKKLLYLLLYYEILESEKIMLCHWTREEGDMLKIFDTFDDLIDFLNKNLSYLQEIDNQFFLASSKLNNFFHGHCR